LAWCSRRQAGRFAGLRQRLPHPNPLASARPARENDGRGVEGKLRRGFSKWAESILRILLGGAIIFPPALLLLIVYGLCLTDPSQPDYHEAKIRRMFSFPDPGFLTWPCAAVVLFGIGVAIVGGIRPFLRKPPGGSFAGTWREKAEAARGKFGHVAGLEKGKGRITPDCSKNSASSADTFSPKPSAD